MIQLSFIILRHVGNESQNIFWNECYDCIRKFYKTEKIYIIDDHSSYKPKKIKGKLFNTEIINSKFPPNRGELLPYYYFYTYKFSKNTIIIHDTVFINKRINPEYLNTNKYHFLWTAKHDWDYTVKNRILEIIKKMDNSNKLNQKFNQKDKWDICFGGMAILNIEYINKIFDNTNYLNILISMIKCRHDRMCFERIISLLLTSDNKIKSINGDIHLDQKWGYTIENYFNKKEKDKLMYKVWVGRKGTTSPLIEKFTTNNQEIVKPLNNIFEMKNIILFFLVIIILFTF